MSPTRCSARRPASAPVRTPTTKLCDDGCSCSCGAGQLHTGETTREDEMEDFYVRYYVGHKGRFGHEFLEFEFKPNGAVRYANNSQYRHDTCIRKEMTVSKDVLNALAKIIKDSEVMKEDDKEWPEPDVEGRQELEITYGGDQVSFATTKIGSLLDVQNSKDPEGLRNFYYLVQDLKCFAFSLITLHTKIKPI